MERVGIFHSKFSNPDKTSSASWFISKLCLDLINHIWELFVTLNDNFACKNYNIDYYNTSVYELDPTDADNVSGEPAQKYLSVLGVFPEELKFTIEKRRVQLYTDYDQKIYGEADMYSTPASNEAIFMCGDYDMDGDIDNDDYIDDVIEAYIKIAEAPILKYNTYNIGTGDPVPVRSILEILLKISEISAPVVVDRKKLRSADTGIMSLDITRIKNELNWYPRTSLEDGLRKTLQYWLNK